jgi:hypothetical protein
MWLFSSAFRSIRRGGGYAGRHRGFAPLRLSHRGALLPCCATDPHHSRQCDASREVDGAALAAPGVEAPVRELQLWRAGRRLEGAEGGAEVARRRSRAVFTDSRTSIPPHGRPRQLTWSHSLSKTPLSPLQR